MRSLRSRLLNVSIALAVLVIGPGTAIAQHADQHRLQWDERRPRVFPGEYAFATSAITAAALIEFGSSQPLKPKWVGPILFDQPIRDALVMPRLRDRQHIETASDVLLVVSAAYPLLIDALLVPAIDRNPDMAKQLTVIDLEAYGVSYLLMRATHRLFARERPAGVGCKTDQGWAYDCGSFGVNASFFSGHSSMSATGAGVTCAHHASLPLYGGGAPDILACIASTGLALTVASTRIVADRHWTTDAISGFLLGYATGLALPFALHYAQHVPGHEHLAQPIPQVGGLPLSFSYGGEF